MSTIKAVIFDWAGTTVDFGCFAPLDVFVEIFERKGIVISKEEARKPMGVAKKDHVKALLEMPRIAKAWEEVHGAPWKEEDLDVLYADFEPSLFKILPGYTEVIDGVVDTYKELTAKNIKIGSTTGYTKDMIEVVRASAVKQGYEPSVIITSDMVNGHGRPAPYMIYQNMLRMGIYPTTNVIKVGDTVSDIQEGLNAGTITVGVVVGSSVMGLTKDEYSALDDIAKEKKCQEVENVFIQAGANYTIRTMRDLIPLIEKLNKEGK